MPEPSAVTKSIKWDLNLSLLLTAINIIGATVWWLSMPARLTTVEKHTDDLEIRLRLQETKAATVEGVLGRIDERTKDMQQNLADMRHEFSFRATGKPID